MLRLLIIFLPVIIAVPIFFFVRARSPKKPVFMGMLCAFSFLITEIILGPIAWNMLLRNADRDSGWPLILSYGAVVILSGVFMAIIVYKLNVAKDANIVNSQSIYCSECGAKCSGNTTFCSKCGPNLKGP